MPTDETTLEARDAYISPCGTYRYALWRTWDEGTSPLVFIGLNPSTADASLDDPTIRRCRGFAKRESYGGLVMLNLFAYRATDPHALLTAAIDPVGERNDFALATYTWGRDVVLAWGSTHADRFAERVHDVLEILHDRRHATFCLGRTKAGHPRHPLYLPATAPIERYFS